MKALSPLHEMLFNIERSFDAKRYNAIINHPDVKPWVQGRTEGELDASPALENPKNYLLLGEHGGVLFHEHMPGYYEAHTTVLPEGRGPWATMMARAVQHWIFTRTQAFEIVTACPKGNIGAKAMARQLGFRYAWTNRLGWTMNGQVVPADIYRHTIQDWMEEAPGLCERGHWFHDKLNVELAKFGKEEPQHEDDLAHDRYVGVCAEMILGGQPDKGVIFYNRWAMLAGYAPIFIQARKPLTINIQNALIIVPENGEFFVASMLE